MRKVLLILGSVVWLVILALRWVLLPFYAVFAGIAYVALILVGVISGLGSVLLWFIEIHPYEWVWPAVMAGGCVALWFLILGLPVLIDLLLSVWPVAWDVDRRPWFASSERDERFIPPDDRV